MNAKTKDKVEKAIRENRIIIMAQKITEDGAKDDLGRTVDAATEIVEVDGGLYLWSGFILAGSRSPRSIRRLTVDEGVEAAIAVERALRDDPKNDPAKSDRAMKVLELAAAMKTFETDSTEAVLDCTDGTSRSLRGVYLDDADEAIGFLAQEGGLVLMFHDQADASTSFFAVPSFDAIEEIPGTYEDDSTLGAKKRRAAEERSR